MARYTLVIFLLVTSFAWGQLPAYTLYYTNPLPINPAFTGSTHKLRAGLNFRTQWTNFSTSLMAYSVYGDNYFSQINSGIGLSIYSDVLGGANYRTTQIAGYYSFTVKLQDDFFLKAGTQISLTQVGFDAGSLTFNDQISSTGVTGNATAETLPIGSQKLYPNVAAGLVLTARSFWLGASVYNLLAPKSGYTDQSKLPIGFGLQTGAKIEFMSNTIGRKIEKKERFVMPNAMVSMIGSSKLVYLGTEVVYDPFCFGFMMKGNFFSSAEGTSNLKSLALTFGIRTGYVQSNYVYEIPLSKTTLLGPSHEINVRTTLKWMQRPTRRPIERLDLF